MKYAALFLSLICLFTLGFLSPISAYADEEISAGTALSIPIGDNNAKDGSIIASTPKGYVLTGIPYDSNIYGVLTESPALFLQNADESSSKPVMSSGKIYVLVSSANGNIAKNDFITSSAIPGVGQKATRNGMILGTALENYSNSDQKATKLILAAVSPHFNASFIDNKTNLLEVLRNASNPTSLTELTSLRYLIAAGIVLLAFAIGFIYFGRVAARGIEAMGRNPLAGRAIQLNLVFNLLLMIVVIIAGLGIGYMILIL